MGLTLSDGPCLFIGTSGEAIEAVDLSFTMYDTCVYALLCALLSCTDKAVAKQSTYVIIK